MKLTKVSYRTPTSWLNSFFPGRSFLKNLVMAVSITLAWALSLNAQSVMPAGSPKQWWLEFPGSMYLIYSPRGATSYHLTPNPETFGGKYQKRTLGGPYMSRMELEQDRTRLVKEDLLRGKDFGLIYVWDGSGRGLGSFCLGKRLTNIGPANRPMVGNVDASLEPVGPCRAEDTYPIPFDIQKFRRDAERIKDEGPYAVPKGENPFGEPSATDFGFGSLIGRATITAPNGTALLLKQEHLKYLSLLSGDHIATGPNASASITGPGAEFRLDRETDMRISSLTVGNPVWEARLILNSGEIGAAIVSGAKLEIDTPTATSSVRGTILRSQFDVEQQTNIISVQEGEVLVTPKNRSLGPVVVRAGSQVRVTNYELKKQGDAVPSAQTNGVTQAQSGQTPALFWAQGEIDASQSQCVARAREALAAERLRNIRDGALPGGTIHWAAGSNSQFNAWITCRRHDAASLYTVMVAGPRSQGSSTESMKFRLRDFMWGRQGDSGLSDIPDYRRVPNARIAGRNIRPALTNVDVEDCIIACEENPECKSFDYHKEKRRCDLNRANSVEVKLRTDSSSRPYDYYEKPTSASTDAMMQRKQSVARARTDMDGWAVNSGKLEFMGSQIEHAGPSDGRTSYYVAPDIFKGDWRQFSILRFDKKSSGGRYYGPDKHGARGDVVISNGELWARHDLSQHHDGNWKTFSVPLKSEAWSLGGGATRLTDVLRNVTELKIRAEYGAGSDRSSLANVELVR